MKCSKRSYQPELDCNPMDFDDDAHPALQSALPLPESGACLEPQAPVGGGADQLEEQESLLEPEDISEYPVNKGGLGTPIYSAQASQEEKRVLNAPLPSFLLLDPPRPLIPTRTLIRRHSVPSWVSGRGKRENALKSIDLEHRAEIYYEDEGPPYQA
ncbi:uncharacterized protein BDZ99DRAFT_147612 [Mytilinidion resinicola]|uniref:Uncharacterized protein n=1 Tax=Mytilinidion resinicola TaxID=574789 RepID=A0A6A6Y6X8_9PEZI|nr:uncharacterized protein BDZ99DRAFT_147612 [Mytilinidion resinicola]KAF2804562.1 hypothetical protein BDZ99DRAFT_147612 [Mytilinidion resinicola]